MADSKKVGTYYTGTPTAEKMFYGNNNLRDIPDGAIITKSDNINVSEAFAKTTPITKEDVGFTRMNKPVMRDGGAINQRNVDITNSLINRMTNTLGDEELFREVKAMGMSAVEVIPRATKTNPGIVIIGNNIDVDNIGTISVKTASKDYAGVVRIGEGISISGGLISLSAASNSVLGGVIVGNNINYDYNGRISVNDASYNSAGVVRIGSNINISGNIISVPVSTSNTLGLVRTGSNINNNSGVISVPVATNYSLGVVKAGSGITISSDGTISSSSGYVHPTTHPGRMITEDSNHRWTTDYEKSKWNGMLPLTGGNMTGTIVGKSINGAWSSGKTDACLLTNVSPSSYTSGVTFKGTTHSFSVGSYGNDQAGIYMYRNGDSSGTSGQLYINTNGDVFCGGTFTAGGDVVGMSDRRLKSDITSIKNAIDTIKMLNGVKFTWKSNGKKSIGLIAQDVKNVIPEAVTFNKDSNSYGVKYGNLVGLLINAIKELNDKVEALEKR